jgi:hypothetical protein
MPLDERLDLGEFDLVVLADDLGSKIAGQAGAAAGTLVGTMLDLAIQWYRSGRAAIFDAPARAGNLRR